MGKMDGQPHSKNADRAADKAASPETGPAMLAEAHEDFGGTQFGAGSAAVATPDRSEVRAARNQLLNTGDPLQILGMAAGIATLKEKGGQAGHEVAGRLLDEEHQRVKTREEQALENIDTLFRDGTDTSCIALGRELQIHRFMIELGELATSSRGFAAARALAKTDNPLGEQILLSRLNHKKLGLETCLHAASGVREMEKPEHASVWTGLLKDKEGNLRSEAVKGLAALFAHGNGFENTPEGAKALSQVARAVVRYRREEERGDYKLSNNYWDAVVNSEERISTRGKISAMKDAETLLSRHSTEESTAILAKKQSTWRRVSQWLLN